MTSPRNEAQGDKPKAGGRILLFDFDGTVADTLRISHLILNDLAKEFRFRELPEEELQIARNMSTRNFIRHLGISKWRVPVIARRGLKLLHERIHEVSPIPGIPEVLSTLGERGHRIGILTSNSEANVSAFLERHDLRHFEFIRTSSKLFGKGREMKRLLQAEKVSPQDVLYIGDETRDIEADQETGLRIAAVTWGYNSADALSSLNPDFLLSSPRELLELVGL